MAENLLRYGFSREDGQAVGNVLTDVQNLISRQSDNLSEMNSFLQELRDIQKNVMDNEKRFYIDFGATNYDDFQEKLALIQEGYSPFLANGKAIWAIRKQIDFANISTARSPEEIAEALRIKLGDFLAEDGREELMLAALRALGQDDDAGEAVIKFIQQNLRLEELTSKKGRKGRFITSRGTNTEKTRVGLGKLIVGYDLEKEDFIIQTEGIEISTTFKKRLEKMLDMLSPTDFRKTEAKHFGKQAFRDTINDIALSTITNEEVKQRLKQTMGNFREFDLHPNLSSVIGYLGEVRAVTLLKHLMPKQFNIRGTGSLRSIQTGAEIPIDVVCESYGFQIKNYTLHKGVVSFTNDALAPHILESRMRLSGTIYDILIALFGVYQYNQPLHPPFKDRRGNEIPEPKNLPAYTQMYNSIYGGNNSLFYQLKPLFDARVPQMLKMSEEFSVQEDNIFSSEAVYFNTFYWINSKLVPSSYILEQLIDQLSRKSEGIIRTNYNLSLPDSGYTYQKHPELAGTTSMTTAANKIRMGYEIDIDLSKIK